MTAPASSHHPVFDGFTPYAGDPEGLVVCALGTLTRPHFIDAATPAPGTVQASWPSPCEEYFEWIDLLEAVAAARGRFTMLELGAGYGRWTSRGAAAARSRGITDLRLGLAEADAQHARWLREHMADNAIGPEQYTLYEAAVGGRDGEVNFYVSTPDVDGLWYGQSICEDDLSALPVVGDYFGRPVVETPGGVRLTRTPQLALSSILSDYDVVDFADLDLQGAEAEAVAEALGPLGEKVRRMHIGTHGERIEANLRRMLSGAGWTCVRDYPCQGVNETEYGPLAFNDGIQTWINPRL